MEVSPKKALRDLEVLKAAGFEIPDPLFEFVETKVDEQDQVKQVWICKKCKNKPTYKTYVVVRAVNCSKEHAMTLLKGEKSV